MLVQRNNINSKNKKWSCKSVAAKRKSGGSYG
jgi:hypothetical protein